MLEASEVQCNLHKQEIRRGTVFVPLLRVIVLTIVTRLYEEFTLLKIVCHITIRVEERRLRN